MTSRSASSSSQSAPYDVVAFSEDALFDSLANEWVDRKGVESQRQARYLSGYLRHFNTATIVVEHNYVDRDYIDDYANFYVESFLPYPRLTRRLHFFDEKFSPTELADAFSGRDEGVVERLKSSYVGFVVARPLPGPVIGRTILRTYETRGTGRHYPVTRDYHPYLFGVPLSIERTLAFQQQDTAVAACATVALWTAFHKTQRLFESPRPSPAQITRHANIVRGSGRAMPSRSLTAEQIGQAIVSANLEPEYIEIQHDTPLSSLMYGYTRMGIPLVLLVYLEHSGYHAITVVGFAEKEGFVHECEPDSGISYHARCIDKWYVHDDNIGPFAYVRIVPTSKAHVGEDEQQGAEAFKVAPYALEVVFYDREHHEETIECAPMFAIAPVDRLIRLTFPGVHVWLLKFSMILEEYGNGLGIEFDRVTWDVRLQSSNEYKGELREHAVSLPSIPPLLLRAYPLYIWRASIYHNGTRLFEVSLDATEVDKALPFLDVICYDAGVLETLRRIFEIESVREKWRDVVDARLVDLISSL